MKSELDDDRITNVLKKKHKNARYKLTPLGFLFLASVKNICKKSLINGILGIINLNKINNWKEEVEVQSIWINTTLTEQKEINSRKHFCFLLTTSSLNYLLSFSINLVDDNNK